MPRQFISEPITPAPGTADSTAMSRGEPGLPRSFSWRGQNFEIAAVLSSWKTGRTDRGDAYVNRHWYEIATLTGERMKIYFERNPASRKKRSLRWWLFTIEQEAL